MIKNLSFYACYTSNNACLCISKRFSSSYSAEVWNRIWNKKRSSPVTEHRTPNRPADLNERSVTTTRLMTVNDANPRGYVHGGVTLQLMEEAGCLAANKYCNTAPTTHTQPPSLSTVVRLQDARFYTPIDLFSSCQVDAEVVFTSQRSLLVATKLYSRDVLTGHSQFASEALMWYTPVLADKVDSVVTVPQYNISCEVTRQRLTSLYEQQKAEREQQQHTQWHIDSMTPFHTPPSPARHTVAASVVTYTYMVMPSDCLLFGYCQGGVTMRIMDQCAGLAAMYHSRLEAVTVGVDKIDFKRRVELGCMMEAVARVVFTSSRSVEVHVAVTSMSMTRGADTNEVVRQKCAEGFYTFVPVSKTSSTVPPIQPVTEEEVAMFERRKLNYEKRKSQAKS